LQHFNLSQLQHDILGILSLASHLRIPGHPAGHSDNIRPPKPVYPAALV
jgi:hypothetical protein